MTLKSSENNKLIQICVTSDLKKALQQYCLDSDIKTAPFMRTLLTDFLTREGYLERK